MPGVQELLVIVVVALLVFGPERMPEIARTVAKTIARFRSETQRNVAELRRLAEIEDLEAELREARTDLHDLSRQAGFDGRQSGVSSRGGARPTGQTRSAVTPRGEAAATAQGPSRQPAASPQRASDEPPPFDTEAT